MNSYEIQITITSHTFQHVAYMVTYVMANGPIHAKRKAQERVLRRARKGEYGQEFILRPKVDATIVTLVSEQLSLC
jgi:hypothetical protein